MLILLLLFLVVYTAQSAPCSNTDGTISNLGTTCECGTATCSTIPAGALQTGPTPGMYCTVASNRCDEGPPCPSTGFADSAATFPLIYPGCAAHGKITIADYGASSSGVVIVGKQADGTPITDQTNILNQLLPVLSGGNKNQVLMVTGKLTISYVRITRGRTNDGACNELHIHPEWSTTKCTGAGIDSGTGNCYEDEYDYGFQRCNGMKDSYYVGVEAHAGPWPVSYFCIVCSFVCSYYMYLLYTIIILIISNPLNSHVDTLTCFLSFLN